MAFITVSGASFNGNGINGFSFGNGGTNNLSFGNFDVQAVSLDNAFSTASSLLMTRAAFSDVDDTLTPSDTLSGAGTSLESSAAVPGTIDVTGQQNAQINAAAGATVLGGTQDTISAAGDVNVQGGTNNTLSVQGALTFIGGAGSNTQISAENATIFGTKNSVYHYVDLNSDGKIVFHADSQAGATGCLDNILFDASSSHQTFQAFVGNGDTIQGGAATNEFDLQNTLTGAQASLAGATLGGASGSTNLFNFLNNKGGHYTIKDFGNSAGDKVELNASEGQIEDMLSHAQLDSKGNTTIQLPYNQGQITFLDSHHIKPEDFLGHS